MSGTWRSGGRGGAGNFVSQKDVDAAEKARRDNVSEMHHPSLSPLGMHGAQADPLACTCSLSQSVN